MNNTEFAKTNADFKTCRAYVGIVNSSRQASKYRRKMGLAWKNRHEAMQQAFSVPEQSIEFAS